MLSALDHKVVGEGLFGMRMASSSVAGTQGRRVLSEVDGELGVGGGRTGCFLSVSDVRGGVCGGRSSDVRVVCGSKDAHSVTGTSSVLGVSLLSQGIGGCCVYCLHSRGSKRWVVDRLCKCVGGGYMVYVVGSIFALAYGARMAGLGRLRRGRLSDVVRFSTGRVTRCVRKVVINSRGTAIRAFTGVRRNIPKTVSFLSGPGCARCVCSARSAVILMGGSFIPRRRMGTALVGMSGTCRDLTGLLALCRVDGPGGANVSPLTCITPATGLKGSMCVTPFTYMNSNTRVNSGASLRPRTAMKDRTGMNGGYALCPRTAVCRSYLMKGRYALRTNYMVNTSKFKFTPSPRKCRGVPRVNVTVVRSGIRVNTGAYMSHTAVNTAVMRGKIGLSGLVRVTRGIRMKDRAIVTSRINVTNSAGMNR